MWKSGPKPHEYSDLYVEKIVNKFIVFHRVRGSKFFPHLSFHISTGKCYEVHSLSLELILDVMSRTTMPVCWSVCRRFSTFRMELRTVAWLRPSYISPMD